MVIINGKTRNTVPGMCLTPEQLPRKPDPRSNSDCLGSTSGECSDLYDLNGCCIKDSIKSSCILEGMLLFSKAVWVMPIYLGSNRIFVRMVLKESL